MILKKIAFIIALKVKYIIDCYELRN